MTYFTKIGLTVTEERNGKVIRQKVCITDKQAEKIRSKWVKEFWK